MDRKRMRFKRKPEVLGGKQKIGYIILRKENSYPTLKQRMPIISDEREGDGKKVPCRDPFGFLSTFSWLSSRHQILLSWGRNVVRRP